MQLCKALQELRLTKCGSWCGGTSHMLNATREHQPHVIHDGRAILRTDRCHPNAPSTKAMHKHGMPDVISFTIKVPFILKYIVEYLHCVTARATDAFHKASQIQYPTLHHLMMQASSLNYSRRAEAA